MTYRFYQVLAATSSPHKALAESTPSPAMVGGIHMEAVVAIQLGLQPWLPDGMEMDETITNAYWKQAYRVSPYLAELSTRFEQPLVYQPVLEWSRGETGAEGHPDFGLLGEDHLLDLKTTEYPTEEWCDKYLYSIQMCAYMAAYLRQYGRPCQLTIMLASRLVEPDPVKFNKDGSVSLSGQNADHASLMEAVRLMGDKADDRHHAMAFKAPVWDPFIAKTLPREKCKALAEIGAIFLDAGLAILDTGFSDMVVRPYA